MAGIPQHQGKPRAVIAPAGGGGSSFGPTFYGTGCTVSPSGFAGQGNTFTSGPTAQAPSITWPIDYSTDFPACSGAACTGPGGTPSFCTSSSTAASETLQSYNPINLTSGNIYCDVGTGTASTPSTWNGAITVSGTAEATFVGGSVTISGGDNLTACGYATAGYTASACSSAVPAPNTTNYPIIYAVQGGINASGGGDTFLGDMFAPKGTVTIGGGTETIFVEAKDISANGGGITGDGPSDATGSSLAGSVALLQ
jgi:hypothetical protein